MAAPSLLGLPPISPSLKSISPYLQRADELRQKEPIMAYWCAYYAAQAGIALKAKDAASRNLLFELLGKLEKMKNEIGPNDAIDVEHASSAYVESFGLRVFSMADDEDRKGAANRSTAKKFLAAANFLEVLKIFPKTEITDSNEEKIRYAKWKAADIAKAFREGRRPVPGPPGSTEEQQPSIPNGTITSSAIPIPPIAVTGSDHSSSPPKRSSPSSSSPPAKSSGSGSSGSRNRSPPQIYRNSPPHLGPLNNIPVTPQSGSLSAPAWIAPGEVTPGSWSTAATPGTDVFISPGILPSSKEAFRDYPESPTAAKSKTGKRNKPRSGSGSSSGSTASLGRSGSTRSRRDSNAGRTRGSPDSGGSQTQPAAQGGNGNANAVALGISNGKKSVHFTPSVVGGLSSTAGSPPTSPGDEVGGPYFPGHVPPPPTLPQIYAPVDATAREILPPRLANIYAPVSPTAASVPQPPQGHHSAATASAPVAIYSRPPEPVELTLAVIAKAQKHCRFAISALDYEDAETAKKELRAALAALGE